MREYNRKIGQEIKKILILQKMVLKLFSPSYISKDTKIQEEEGRTCVMSDKVIENNQVSVIGEIVSEFTFSHEVFGEGFYMMDVLVRRLSDSADIIPVMISERLINVD